jgi:hypothetical protein
MAAWRLGYVMLSAPQRRYQSKGRDLVQQGEIWSNRRARAARASYAGARKGTGWRGRMERDCWQPQCDQRQLVLRRAALRADARARAAP